MLFYYYSTILYLATVKNLMVNRIIEVKNSQYLKIIRLSNRAFIISTDN